MVSEKKDSREEFADFYTNRSGDTRSLNTQLSARAGHTTVSSDRKVSDNSSSAQASEDNIRFRDDNNAKLKEKYTDDQIFDTAKQMFGVTDDIREAGYILPDGSMLDFSGRYAVDGDASHLKGGRHMDIEGRGSRNGFVL